MRICNFTKHSFRIITSVMIAGTIFGSSCRVMADDKTIDIISEDTVPLIQEGDIIIPEEDYTYNEDRIVSYLDLDDQSTDSARQKKAQQTRENNDSTIDERKEACAKKLYEAMINLQDSVTVTEYALTVDEFREVISDVINSNPELFYIRQDYGYGSFPLSSGSDTYIVSKCMGYYEGQSVIRETDPETGATRIIGYTAVDTEGIQAKKQQIEAKRDKIIAAVIPDGAPQYVKALLLHDYIVLNTEYDYENYTRSLNKQGDIPDSDYDIYGTLIDEKAVCQGYSLAYKYLMEAAGVDSIGFASSSGHIWNTVTINGEGYYVDCTWDDPSWDTLGNVKHRNLLKGDNDFTNHTILKTDRECNGNEFASMFWNEVNSGIFYQNGCYYYINADGMLCKRSGLGEDASISTASLSLEERDGWNYSNAAKLALGKTYAVYHDDKNLYAYDLKDGKKGLIYTPDIDKDELIYGVAAKDDNLTYGTKDVNSVLASSGGIAQQKIYSYELPDDPFNIPVSSVAIEGPDTLHIYMENGTYVYEKSTLSTVITPANATNQKIRKWTSSNTSVLKVDLNGKIVAVGVGEATVTVYTYDGPSATYNIKVVLDGDIKADDGSILHYDEGKLLCNQFYTENGNTYFLGSDGKIITGMNKINGNIYYFDSSGVMLTGWQVINGNTHYFNSSGIMLTGWQSINNKTYYFNSSGIMLTGWQTINGTQYYFDSNGVLQTVGWKKIDGKTYYFNLHSVTVKGWQNIDGKKYYFDSKGVMQTGWQTIKKKKYYFDNNGVMQTGWKTIKKKKYYFNKNGVMQTGWKTIKKKKYYFNKKGVMQTGWKKIKGKKYYFTKKGVMVKGVQYIKGIPYYFASDGHFVS